MKPRIENARRVRLKPWHRHRVAMRDELLQQHRARKLAAAFRRYGLDLPDGFFVWKTGCSITEVGAARDAFDELEQAASRVSP
jgi:hypothetical protein